MFKFLLIFIFTTLSFASIINFEEEKFVNSLQTSIYKKGSIEIANNIIKVFYKNSDNSYIFYSDHFILKEKDKETKLNYEERTELSVFYQLINLIYRDKKEDFNEFFQVQEGELETTLIPNEYLANVIEKIEYKKEQNKLKFLKIYFMNEDWIKIVQN